MCSGVLHRVAKRCNAPEDIRHCCRRENMPEDSVIRSYISSEVFVVLIIIPTIVLSFVTNDAPAVSRHFNNKCKVKTVNISLTGVKYFRSHIF
jgi:hypothetical protein